jgi:2-keto-4-pentenoate hydratase/2-oxohepta-3-ene-1,7-dioic acid hydratase in catechol pathway
MRLIRFGTPGNERPGLLLEDGTRLDASAAASDYDEAFFVSGGLDRLGRWFRDGGKEHAPRVDGGMRLGPPVARPSKIVCVGLNYLDHAAESGLDPPAEPVLFMKASTSLSGPFDPIELPRGSEKTDWEIELAVIIGRTAKYVEERDAMEYVAGFAIMNDVSERAFQIERGGQWVKGKSCDTFSPLGPALVTTDEIDDVHDLNMSLTVNGESMQDGSTSMMIFNVPVVVSYVSRFMTLVPGDVISTGTPAGVGLGMKPPRYLREGDIVALRIETLGTSRQEVVAPRTG